MHERRRYWVYECKPHGPLLVDLLHGAVVGRVVKGGFRTAVWKMLKAHRTIRDPYTDRVWQVHRPNDGTMRVWQWSFQRGPWGSLSGKGMDVHHFRKPEDVPPFRDGPPMPIEELICRLDRLRMRIPHSTRPSKYRWVRPRKGQWVDINRKPRASSGRRKQR